MYNILKIFFQYFPILIFNNITYSFIKLKWVKIKKIVFLTYHSTSIEDHWFISMKVALRNVHTLNSRVKMIKSKFGFK